VSQLATEIAHLETRNLTPSEIVAELDRYIVGQADAKRAVAIAIRNRWRRQNVREDMREEVAPKNILMVGPTGVGKTEIARRLARLTGAPFIKVEATKYTEVGYYGRDVESMIRDLVENAIGLVRERERKNVEGEARQRVEERLLDLLAPRPTVDYDHEDDAKDSVQQYERTRAKMRAMLAAGELDQRKVELTIEQKAMPIMVGSLGLEQMDMDLQGMFEKILPRTTSRREMTVTQARDVMFEQECDALLDPEKINAAAVEQAENMGIIFVDELDKVVASDSRGADVSRQGVQRDLLPIVEGTTVQTRYGYVRTDHILFVAAGAFHRAKPSDLMPELQGRFPIRVELNDLTKDDFVRILTEPQNSLTKQYAALMDTEQVTLSFTDDAIDALAAYAYKVNQSTQNIGARRLYTIMERVLEELSFDAPDKKRSRVAIDAEYVRQRLEDVTEDEELSKFIL
jgi:ATP-dependent HslUV protease ATP-binding subunit HslU